MLRHLSMLFWETCQVAFDQMHAGPVCPVPAGLCQEPGGSMQMLVASRRSPRFLNQWYGHCASVMHKAARGTIVRFMVCHGVRQDMYSALLCIEAHTLS